MRGGKEVYIENIKPGEVIQISHRLQNDVRGEGKVEKKKYEVL